MKRICDFLKTQVFTTSQPQRAISPVSVPSARHIFSRISSTFRPARSSLPQSSFLPIPRQKSVPSRTARGSVSQASLQRMIEQRQESRCSMHIPTFAVCTMRTTVTRRCSTSGMRPQPSVRSRRHPKPLSSKEQFNIQQCRWGIIRNLIGYFYSNPPNPSGEPLRFSRLPRSMYREFAFRSQRDWEQ